MFKSIRLWFMLLIIVGGLGIAACGSDDKDATATTAADTTPEDGAGTTPDGGNTPDDSGNGGSDGAFGDIPVPDGADEVDSGTFSGAQVPFIDPSGSVDASTFGDIQYKIYETSDSAESVIEFYSDELSGWDEAYKFSGGAGDAGAGGFGIWTKDDGQTALWVGASEADGTTSVTVIVGSAS
jgi:hypothetical protein